MSDLEGFKEKIKRLSTLTVITQEVFLYCEYFHRPNTQQELELYRNKVIGPHLSFIRHLLFRNLIVELHKLFSTSKNDKLNLLKIIKEAYGYHNNEKVNLSVETIKEFQDKIKMEEDNIQVIKNLRNKLYAHSDIIKIEDCKMDIGFKEISNLVDIAKEIVRYLYNAFLESDFIFRPLSFDRERFILFNLLITGEKERIKEIYRNLGFNESEG